FVFRAGLLVADLPVAHVVRLRVAVARPEGAHRCVVTAVEVLDLLGGVLWRPVQEAHAEQRLRARGLAEADDLLQPRAGRLQAAPGAERRAAVRIAEGVLPLEV